MKIVLLKLSILINLIVLAQDGSDIYYIDEDEIDTTLIGKFIHIDFFNNSFGCNKFENVKADTVHIIFQKKKLSFIEVRNDNRYNNWFSEQFLISTKDFKGSKLIIQKMKLLNISNDSIKVKLFAHYYMNSIEIFSEFLTDTTSISRKEIFQILVDANPPINQGLSVYRVYLNPPVFTNKEKPDCYYCFEPNENNIFDSPILSDYHIKRFDYEKQQIILTELGKKIMEKIDIPLEGMPVVFTLNSEIIYGFWFWNKYSSFGCDRVYTNPKFDFKLKFGLPESSQFGNDPRFDIRLEEYENNK
jgi:hypothetical protein